MFLSVYKFSIPFFFSLDKKFFFFNYLVLKFFLVKLLTTTPISIGFFKKKKTLMLLKSPFHFKIAKSLYENVSYFYFLKSTVNLLTKGNHV